MPALLLMTVRFFVPRRSSAASRFSGLPQTPKPPTISVAPSGIRATASSAERRTLSIRPIIRIVGHVRHAVSAQAKWIHRFHWCQMS